MSGTVLSKIPGPNGRSRWLLITLGSVLLFVAIYLINNRISQANNDDIADVPVAAHQLYHSIATGDSPAIGSPEAAVKLVLFSDFSCSHCYNLFETLESVRSDEKYQGVFHMVFFCNPVNASGNGLLLANVAKFAQRAGKFWELYPLLYAMRNEITEGNVCRRFYEFLSDTTALRAYLNAPSHDVLKDMKAAREAGIQAVPALVLDGKVYYGELSREQLISMLKNRP